MGGGKAKNKGVLGSGWMHVVVSSTPAVLQHYIISFVIVCFGFIVVPAVSYMFFLRVPCSFCIRCTSFLFLLFVLVLRHRLLLVARWFFILLRLILAGS